MGKRNTARLDAIMAGTGFGGEDFTKLGAAHLRALIDAGLLSPTSPVETEDYGMDAEELLRILESARGVVACGSYYGRDMGLALTDLRLNTSDPARRAALLRACHGIGDEVYDFGRGIGIWFD